MPAIPKYERQRKNYYTKLENNERKQTERYDNARRNTINQRNRQDKYARDEQAYNTSRNEARKNKVNNSRNSSMLEKDNRANPTGDYAHYKQLQNKRDYEKLDRAGKKAEAWARDKSGIAKNSARYNNPTASGDGKGGKMDREWKNHKWSTRERDAKGKWRYDYDMAKMKKGVSPEANLRAKEMSDKRSSRNKGKAYNRNQYQMQLLKQKGESLARNASKIASNASDFIRNTGNTAISTISNAGREASSFISNLANTAINFLKG